MNEALLFKLEEQTFAFPVSCINEVVRSVLPSPLPRAPLGCLGALDIRGAVVPLLDLGVILGLRGLGRDEGFALRFVKSHVLLTSLDGHEVGWLVDRVLDVGEQVADFNADRDLAVLAEPLRELVRGTVVCEKNRAFLLDPDRLVGKGRQRLLRRSVPSPPGGQKA